MLPATSETFAAQPVVAVQSVLSQQYWSELRAGVKSAGLDLVHVVLDADDEALKTRIYGDDVECGAEQWRLDHIPTYRAALPWLAKEADLVIDTTGKTTDDVVAQILALPLVSTAAGADERSEREVEA